MIDLKAHWKSVIEHRSDYDHPEYPVSEWKRDVLSGKTRQSYASHVSALLVENRPEIPAALRQFRPKTTFGKTLQRAVVTEFDQNGACFVASANGHGWFAMRFAFENLIPFIVAKGEDSFIVAKATDENKKDLREIGAEKIYEWDGWAVPRYEDM